MLPKEAIGMDAHLPQDKMGHPVTATWFNPLTGGFSKPVEKQVGKWNYYAKPNGDSFAIVILEIASTE